MLFDQDDLMRAIKILEQCLEEVDGDRTTGIYDRINGRRVLNSAIHYIVMSYEQREDGTMYDDLNDQEEED